MKRKWMAAILTGALCVGMLAGCGSENNSGSNSGTNTASVSNADSSASSDAEDYSNLKLCYLAQANNTFTAKLVASVEETCQEMGVKVDVFNADNDVTTQLNQMESAIAAGYDAIILQAVDSAGCKDGAKSIMDAGIPLVACNLLIDDETYDVYVGSEDYDAGYLMGNFIKEQTGGEAKVGLLYVPIGCSAEIGRTKGLHESLFDVCEGVEIVAEDDGQALIDEGMRITEDWLVAYPEITVIAAENDSMALGAMQACASAGRDDIMICGVDADPEAVQAVIDGKMACTVLQDSAAQASTSVEVALELATGKTYDKQVLIPFQLVTAENAEDFL